MINLCFGQEVESVLLAARAAAQQRGEPFGEVLCWLDDLTMGELLPFFLADQIAVQTGNLIAPGFFSRCLCHLLDYRDNPWSVPPASHRFTVRTDTDYRDNPWSVPPTPDA